MPIKVTNTEEKRLNLKNDIVFKAFFAEKGNEVFLIDFLEALLKTKIKNIKIQEEKNLLQLTPTDKGGRLDLQAQLNDGVIVNIELQMKNEYNTEKRLTYYGAKNITQAIDKGQDYNEMKDVIIVAILGYNLLNVEEYISETKIVLDKHRDYEVIKNIKWYFIELPKFRKINPNMNDKLNQWIAFLDDYDRRLVEMAVKNNEILEKAKVKITRITGDEIIRRRAQSEEEWIIDRNSAISYAKEKALEEGIEQGLKEGRKKGKKQGIKEGKRESQIEIAKEMIKKNMEIELISEITKLAIKDIEKIKQEV